MGLGVGHLIYASGSLPAEPYDLIRAGVRLEIHKVDLSRHLGVIEHDVIHLRRSLLLGVDCADEAAFAAT